MSGILRRLAAPVRLAASATRAVPAARGMPHSLTHSAHLLRASKRPFASAATPDVASSSSTGSGVPGVPVPSNETVSGAGEKHTFQAETTQLMHIVANSLYTDKHVFIRELVSNASDALEKARHTAATGKPLDQPETPLAITVSTDEASKTITFSDSGIGMNKAELIENLGTIARSGSKAFLAKLKEGGSSASDTGTNIIGQFGVGFYSAFMVADSVKVFSRSAIPGSQGYCWTSTGDGNYEIATADNVARGTKIVVTLKDACKEFASSATVKGIINRYSNFVTFPVVLDGKQLNTVGALWTQNKSDITEEQYAEFYKYKSGDFEPPLFRLHFASDAPIALKALLFVGGSHDEKFGMGRMKPGVDLYSRRVLIESSSRIMPDWLRFVHGVVDSEDIPLNISRESMQDSALIKRLKTLLTRRVLRFLEAEARKEPEKYATTFFPEFGNFLKEGAVTDTVYGAEIARLLRFESSQQAAGKMTSLDEYVSRMTPGQQDIYYLVAPHRGVAEASPYMEAFKGSAAQPPTEVLYLYSPLDDFVMNNLREFNGRKLVTAETAGLDPAKLKGAGEASQAEPVPASANDGLNETQISELGSWLQKTLPKRISRVRATRRLNSSPAVVTDHESAAIRRMMRMVEQTAGRDSEAVKSEAHILPPQTLEINPAHPIILQLNTLREAQPDLAHIIAEQMLDNALIAAGLVDDPRTMLPRLTAVLERLAGVASAFKSTADVVAKRFVSEREADEVAGIDASQTSVDEITQITKESVPSDVEELEKIFAGAGGEGSSNLNLDALLDEVKRRGLDKTRKA